MSSSDDRGPPSPVRERTRELADRHFRRLEKGGPPESATDCRRPEGEK